MTAPLDHAAAVKLDAELRAAVGQYLATVRELRDELLRQGKTFDEADEWMRRAERDLGIAIWEAS